MKTNQKQLMLAIMFACLTSSVQGASSDYIQVNPEGPRPTATGTTSVAVGINTHASGQGSYASGIGANASGRDAAAIGLNAIASGRNAISVGGNAAGQASVAMGHQSSAAGINNVAVGRRAEAGGVESMAIGSGTKTFNVPAGGTEVTRFTTLVKNYTMAGYAAPASGAGVSGSGQVAVGTDSQAAGAGASALGSQAYALNDQTSALGNDAKALGYASSAVGTHSYAYGANSTALGNGSEALGAQSNAIGSGSAATADKAIAVGWGAGASGANAIAIGTHTGAVQTWRTTGGATSAIATSLGQWAASGDRSIAVGTDTLANANDSVAIGTRATSTVVGGVALGTESVANRGALNGATTSASASATANQVYAMDAASAADKAAITATVQGNQGAVSVGANGQTRQITNVAAGSEDSDAVNVSQLKSVANQISSGTNTQITNITNQVNDNSRRISGLEGRVNRLDNRIDKVGAGAAALAGLHPLDFNPDDKWNVAVGYGNYSGANAMAVGAFYRPNEDMMFNVASSMGNGENMVSAGMTFNFGQSSGVSRSRVAMAKEIEALYARVAQLEAQSANNNGKSTNSTQDNVEFPDVPENHWAYVYVTELANQGLLTGYPDGTFKGNQTMTRYEFAAVMYRALQNGAPVDGNMARATSEFAPEMTAVQQADRFRVDRVHGGENDRYKVERVRINSEDRNSRDIYGGMISNTK